MTHDPRCPSCGFVGGCNCPESRRFSLCPECHKPLSLDDYVEGQYCEWCGYRRYASKSETP